MIYRILLKNSPGRSLLRAYIRRQALFRFRVLPLFLSGLLQCDPLSLYSCQIISSLLRPRNWKPPANRRFFLDSYEVGELCYAAEQIFMHEPTVLQLKAPVKVFGDLHGQFGDLMRLFDEYGFPSTAGDIT